MKQSDDLGLFSALIAASAASGNVATVPDTQTTAGDGSASIALGFPQRPLLIVRLAVLHLVAQT